MAISKPPPTKKEHKAEEDLRLENKAYYSICNKPTESTVLMAAYETERRLMYKWRTELFIRS